jgi:phenylacetate-CoA ligase
MNFLRSFLWNSLNKNNINIAKDLFKNKDNFESIKNNFLVKILNHAKKNVPYYKEKFSNIDFSNFQVSDLYKLPILTKKELKKDFEKLKSNDIDTRKWWENTS